MEEIKESLTHAISITTLVFGMMVLVDYLNVSTKGKIKNIIRGGGWRQYIISPFLSAIPGCLGSFMNISFFVRGVITFGALAGAMLASSGDAAFVMLSLFPLKALYIFLTLFIIGAIFAPVIDKAVRLLNIEKKVACTDSEIHSDSECRICSLKEIYYQIKNITLARFLLIFILIAAVIAFIFGWIGPDVWNWEKITFVVVLLFTLFIVATVSEHYLDIHIWEHIAKKHLWKIFLWSFGALLLIHLGSEFLNLKGLASEYTLTVLIMAAVLGLIPDSGPHLIFVVMFSQGIIPFSVLLTSSIVQDGHGLLPLLSYSIKDSILIKIFNLIIGLLIGVVVFLIGW